MHKTLCRSTIKTVCTHRGRNMHTHTFHQIYKAVRMPDSVLLMSVIVALGAQGRASFTQPHFAINGCRNATK